MKTQEELCLDPGTPNYSESAKPGGKSSAFGAPSGGPSNASIGTPPEPAESTTSVETAATPNAARASIDGWILDDSNVCGHKLHRTIRARDGRDFPVSISLTAGDMDDEAEPMVEVSERALRWLLTGQVGT